MTLNSLLFVTLLSSIAGMPLMGMMENDPTSTTVQSVVSSKPVEKGELYVVVGSARDSGNYINPFAKKIFGEGEDLSHINTFNNKATTLDITPSKIKSAPHIQADALTYKPSSNTKIKAIFMELFPSIKVSSAVELKDKTNDRDPAQEFNDMMLMPQVIRNLAKSMDPGSSLEIEHMPFISNLEMNFYSTAGTFLTQSNPFHAFLSPFFMESIIANGHKNKTDKGNYWKSVLANKKSIFQWDDVAAKLIVTKHLNDQNRLSQAVQNVLSLLSNDSTLAQRLELEGKLYTADSHRFYTTMFRGSLSELIAMEYTMLTQQEEIKEFLKRSGFDNPIVERKDNPHNKRKNVWMISAVRNDHPVPKND